VQPGLKPQKIRGQSKTDWRSLDKLMEGEESFEDFRKKEDSSTLKAF
jgi:hypothetical protein